MLELDEALQERIAPAHGSWRRARRPMSRGRPRGVRVFRRRLTTLEPGEEQVVALDDRAVLIVAVALFFALTIQAFAVKPYRIPSESMLPTLKPGQRILVDRFSHRLGGDPKLGDVTVFLPPIGADNGTCGHAGEGPFYSGGEETRRSCSKPASTHSEVTFVKRVVGMPGDTIAIIDGHVIRNGKRASEPFASGCSMAECNLNPITVPRALLHDGRQPRQQRRLPLLGSGAAQVDHRQGHRLLLAAEGRRHALGHPPDALSEPSADHRRMLFTGLPSIDVEALRARLYGEVYGPDDEGWDEARRAWNLAVDQRPAAVALPSPTPTSSRSSTSPASKACASRPRAPATVPPRSPASTTILLSTKRMRGVRIDPNARRARVRAGAIWQDVTAPASAYGLAPARRLRARRRRRRLHARRRPQLARAQARLRVRQRHRDRARDRRRPSSRTDEHNDPELFRALRGGGGNFGVVTAMEFKLYPVEELTGGALLWPRSAPRRSSTPGASGPRPSPRTSRRCAGC